MKKKLLLTVAVVVALLTVSFVAQQATVKKYKCLIQLTNYKGDGAYIVASLINPQGKYEQTLQVLMILLNGGNFMANAKQLMGLQERPSVGENAL